VSKWLALFGALRQGAILAKPREWKTRQVVVTAVLGVLTVGYKFAAGFGWLPEGVSEDLIANLAQAAGATLFSVYTIYTVVATTDKIGLPPKSAPGADVDGVCASEGSYRPGDLPPDVSRGSGGHTAIDKGRGPFLDNVE